MNKRVVDPNGPLVQGVITGGVAVVALVLFTVLMDRGIMPLLVSGRAVLPVPTVQGLSLEEAQEQLVQHNLVPIVNQSKPSAEVSQGYIIAQDPLPNVPVKEERRIYLVVSEGPKILPIPNVSQGQSLRQARIILQEQGFKVAGIDFQFSTAIPRNVVISQDPAAGTLSEVGGDIHLLVSEGTAPPGGAVPSFLGYNLTTARTLARKLRLSIGAITTEVNLNLVPNTVVGQSVEAGTPLSEGLAIELVVSTPQDTTQTNAAPTDKQTGQAVPLPQ